MKSILIISFILVICLFACNSNSSKRSEEKKLPSDFKMIDNEGVAISVNSYGQGDHTLLFVHGWCIDQSYWSEQVRAFQSNYKVVTVDLPGFGASGKNRKDWSIESYADDVNAVIAQLNLERVILVGHSMGGDIVLEAALNNDKVIALVGVDNFKEVGIDYTDQATEEINSFMKRLKTNYSETVRAFADAMLFHPETNEVDRNRVMEDILQANREIALATLESLFDYAEKEAQKLSEFDRKLFLINSDATPTNEEGLEATGVKFEVIDINATGHYPMIEKPETFNQLLKDLLSRVETAPNL